MRTGASVEGRVWMSTHGDGRGRVLARMGAAPVGRGGGPQAEPRGEASAGARMDAALAWSRAATRPRWMGVRADGSRAGMEPRWPRVPAGWVCVRMDAYADGRERGWARTDGHAWGWAWARTSARAGGCVCGRAHEWMVRGRAGLWTGACTTVDGRALRLGECAGVRTGACAREWVQDRWGEGGPDGAEAAWIGDERVLNFRTGG